MKVSREIHDVQVEGVIKQKEFTIKASAEAFRILSSGLYQNKPRAILRELGTNAYDSHVAAANAEPDEAKRAEILSKPFCVKLPNYLDPTFKIRDFGTGLTDKQIQSLYTSYFSSDKTETNDVTGCFGLGSKSPFSYTDSFTVTSYVKGRMSMWNAFIGEKGSPIMAFIGSQDTSEPDGLEISFPVRTNDISTFLSEAKEVYKYFKLKPVISGQAIVWNEVEGEARFSGTDWKCPKNPSSGHLVIMGNVAYPVNWRTAGVTTNLISYITIELDIPIGSVDIVVSREALEYTDRTKLYLQNKFEEISKEIELEVVKDFEKQSCYWDACNYHYTNSLFLPRIRDWNNRSIRSQSVDVPVSGMELRLSYGNKISVYKINTSISLSYQNPRSMHKFIINDLDKGGERRVRHMLRTSNNRSSRVFLLEKFQDAATQAKFFETLGCPDESILVSSLPKAVYNKGVSTGPKKKTIQVVIFDHLPNKPSYAWKEPETPPTGGYYVPIEFYEPVNMGGFDSFRNKVHALILLDPSIAGKIYGVRRASLEDISEDSNWIPLTTLIEDVKTEWKDDLPLAVNISTWESFKWMSQIKSVNPELARFVANVEATQTRRSQLRGLNQLISSDEESTLRQEDVNKQYLALADKYPMFIYFSKKGTSINDTHYINHYIELIEQGETK